MFISSIGAGALFCSTALGTAAFVEDFSTCKPDQPVNGQNSWKAGLYGGHPSCQVISVDIAGKKTNALKAPGGRDYHVYRHLPPETMKALFDGKAIKLSFLVQGSANFGLGRINQRDCDGIKVKCGNSLTIITGKDSHTGLTGLDGKRWNKIILILVRHPEGFTVTAANASSGIEPVPSIIAGLDQLKWECPPAQLSAWNGIYLRLDAGAMFTDLRIEASGEKNPAEKFKTTATKAEFEPILLHLAKPRSAESLGGVWTYCITALDKRPEADSSWKAVMVPGNHADIFRAAKKQAAWFRKNFTANLLDDQRMFLCFERVTDICELYINGRKAGTHDEAFYPFRIDITDCLKAGKNLLELKVLGPAVTNHPPYGDRPDGWQWYLPLFAGIPFPVHLETTGTVTVDDVYVIPSLSPEPALRAEITLTNRGKTGRRITLEAAVGKEFRFPPKNIYLAPGTCSKVELSGIWQRPHLWWPHDPYLYFLDVKVSGNGKSLDGFRQRFGFREISSKGPDLLLNGVRFLHRRNSFMGYRSQAVADFFTKQISLLKSRGYNGSRMRGGPSVRFAIMADEGGFLITTEAAVDEPRGHEVSEKFWNPAREHTLAMVKTLRNHPSIIYWGLSNEFASYYMKGTPEEKARVDRWLLETGHMVEKLDPTRIWTCSGDSSLGGVGHDGPAPTLSFHYPSEPFKSRYTLPIDAYWLSGKNVSWQGIKWRHDKPLIFSEDLFMPYCIRPPGGMARWSGNAAYDINAGYYQGWRNCIRMFAEGYYYDKLAGWNPWATDAGNPNNPLYSGEQPMPDYLLCTREMNTTFFSGEKVPRTLFVYNQMFARKPCTLQAELTTGDKTYGAIRQQFDLPGGGRKTCEITLSMPVVSGKTKVRWQLSLNTGDQVLTSRTYDYTVYPGTAVTAPSNCALLSATPNVLNGVNFPKGRFSSLDMALASGADKLVIVAWQSGGRKDSKKLDRAVNSGLRVLWIEPGEQEPLPLRMYRDLTETFAFVRSPLDPVMGKIEDSDLKLWRNNGFPVTRAFVKPATGTFDILTDSGTGQKFANLVRAYRGRGYYLLCLLPVASRYHKEPAAAYVARQLISRFDRAPANTVFQLDIASTNSDTVTALKKLGIPCTDTSSGRLIWINAKNISRADIAGRINTCTAAGGTAIIDGIDPAAAAAISQLTGQSITLEKTPATSLIVNENPVKLLAGIANDDLYWRQSNDFAAEAIKRINGRKCISKDRKMLDFAFKPNSGITIPVSPGGIAILPCRNGRLILMTVKWLDFLKLRPERVSRIIVSLLHNLGGQTTAGNGRLKEYTYVPMAGVMNREFWHKNKSTSAWFGQGEDDMRYFPVNRPGIDPVLKLPQPAEIFPVEPLSLGGINFKLVDPDRNHGKGCLVIKPGEEVKIPLNGKVGKLWMIGALDVHCPKNLAVAKVSFNYPDKPAATLELKSRVHLGGYQYPTDMERGIVAWNGINPVRNDNVIWCWNLENPDTARKVSSVSIKATGPRSLVLIGMTAEN